MSVYPTIAAALWPLLTSGSYVQEGGLATPLKTVMLSAAMEEVNAAVHQMPEILSSCARLPPSVMLDKAPDGFPAAGSRLPRNGVIPQVCTGGSS